MKTMFIVDHWRRWSAPSYTEREVLKATDKTVTFRKKKPYQDNEKGDRYNRESRGHTLVDTEAQAIAVCRKIIKRRIKSLKSSLKEAQADLLKFPKP